MSPSVRVASVTATLRARPQEIIPSPLSATLQPPLCPSLSRKGVYTLVRARKYRFIVSWESAGYILFMGFGIGFNELIIVGLLFLILFGPSKLPQMARDIGKFVSEARRSMDEFKSELTSADDEDEDDRAPKRKRK